jgi:hypothetical protein
MTRGILFFNIAHYLRCCSSQLSTTSTQSKAAPQRRQISSKNDLLAAFAGQWSESAHSLGKKGRAKARAQVNPSRNQIVLYICVCARARVCFGTSVGPWRYGNRIRPYFATYHGRSYHPQSGNRMTHFHYSL